MTDKPEDDDFALLAQRVLDAKRRRFEKGDAEALLDALSWCLMYEVLPPEWVRDHVAARLERFHRDPGASLDAEFQIKRPTNSRVIKKLRARQHLPQKVAFRLLELQKQGRALSNDDAYLTVARELRIKVSEVKEHWRVAKSLLNIKLPRKKPAPRA